jgi:NADH dehydrogenase
MGRKVFVTGATGFVGREVLRQLHAAGYAARILARDPSLPRVREIENRLSIEVRSGDVTHSDLGLLAEAMTGTDAVIHLVGIISEAGRSTFETIHTRGTKQVVAAAQRAGVRRFLHMSALGTRPDAASRYHQTKWAAEEAVRQSGLNYTIFRPSLIYGPEDQFVNLFASIARFSPVLPVMGEGAARFQPIAVECVAQAFVRALEEPQASGQTYDLCGPDTLSLPELLAQVAAALGKTRWILRVPLPLARLQAVSCELIFGRLLRQPPPLNRDQLIMLQEDNVGNGAPAARLFGLEDVMFGEGIRRWLGNTKRET